MRFTRSLVIVLIILLAALGGCGGGSGSSSGGTGSGHVPSLSALTLNPTSAIQNSGNGTVDVYYSFEFADVKGDLASMTVTVYDGNGTELGSVTDQLQGASGIPSGYINGTITADTTAAGSYKIEFSVADSTGSSSNKITATFTIVPAASVVSITVTPADPVIAQGGTQQFAATAVFSDSTILDITSLATWTSSDTSAATIDSHGLAAALHPGSATITASSGGVSGSTDLWVVAGFAPAVNYPGDSSTSLGNTAIGDLNGDGRNDVVVIERFGPRIFIYAQNADHTLSSSPQVITTDLNLRGVAIADVNNDGLAELIVAGNKTVTSGPLGRIYVYKQDRTTHALGQPQQYTVSNYNLYALAAADLNNDTLPDIVSTGLGSGNGTVSFLFQGTNGTLGPEITYTSVPLYPGGELHVADMDGNGTNDIVLQSGPKQLAVIKQVSPGTFSTVPDFYTIQTSYWPNFWSFALGDVNGDGRTDIAVADPGNDGYLNIFLQNSSGTLSASTLLTVSNSVQDEVDIADLDGDGLNEIILLSYGDTVRVLFQAPDHTFPGFMTWRLPTSSQGGTAVHQALTVGDVTGDGLPDIVASWSDEGIFVMPRLP